MKITYLFREKRPGNFSIEELFGAISAQVAHHHEVKNFVCSSPSRWQNMKDVKQLHADIFHITGDINYLSFALPKGQTVITIHDLGHYEMTLKGIKKQIYKQLWLGFPLKRASKISTISQFTKAKLIQYFDIPESKIQVIPNPAPLHIFKKTEKQGINARPKILQIGSGHNKNIQNLIDAVTGMEVELMLLRKYDEALHTQLNDKNIAHNFYPNLDYHQVYQKYVACDMLYFASNYEGFGVPILEAQAVGRPVLTSTTAAMPEVAGHAAYLVDHHSVSETKEGISKILYEPTYAASLVSAGYENVQRFRIETIIDQYLALYQSIA